MSSVHGIVSQHHGSITVESSPGKGSTFSLYFPQGEWPEIEKIKPRTEPVATVAAQHRILVVEDNALVRELTVKLLTREGFQVLEAQNGPAALSLLDELTGDLPLLLTDVIMPELNGKELSLEIKRRYPQIKVLFMSGYSSTDMEHESILEKDDHSIQKPFTRKDLIDELNKLIG